MSGSNQEGGFSLFSFQFPDLGQILYDNLVKPVIDFFGNIWNSIVSGFQWLGESIYKGFLWIVDNIIGFFEYALNNLRGYLPYAIAIALSWTIITRSWESEKLSLPKKILLTIVAPFVGAIIGKLLDMIIPPGVQLPRFSVAIQLEKPIFRYYHGQYSDAIVTITEITTEVVPVEYHHAQYSYASVKLMDMYVSVFDEAYHDQRSVAYISFITLLSVYDEYSHLQYSDCIITIR